MKIKILAVFLLLFLASSNFAVSGINVISNNSKTPFDETAGFIKWEKTFDSGKYDMGECIQQTNDGGYICVAECGFKVWLVKIDDVGTVEWDRFFDHGNPDYARYVIQTDDNGYLVLAETEIDDFEHVWLIKTDENGNKVWERFHRYKHESSGFCIQPTKDGGYIITGYASPFNWLNSYDCWLLKVDNLGYEEWNKTYERPNYNRAYSVKQTLDDGYIIVGGKCLDLDSNSDVWLIKTDVNGNMEWEKTFGDESTWNMGRCVQLTSDGGYVIAGEQLLIKVDADGNEEWSRPIGSMCVQQTVDGGYITTGFKFYWWKDTFKSTDLKIVKTDSNGDIEWTRIYGGEYRDSGNFVIQTPDKGFVVIGYKEFPDNYPVQERDIWIIKTGEKPLVNSVEYEEIVKPDIYQPKLNFHRFFLNLLSRFLEQMINFR